MGALADSVQQNHLFKLLSSHEMKRLKYPPMSCLLDTVLKTLEVISTLQEIYACLQMCTTQNELDCKFQSWYPTAPIAITAASTIGEPICTCIARLYRITTSLHILLRTIDRPDKK